MSYLETNEPACESCAGDDGIGLVIQGKPRPVGSIQVTRALPTIARRMIGPFIFLDHMGPVSFASGTGFDVLPHPHIGLSTVTYLFEGTSLHRDSLGNVQAISPGDINLMTAGKGIVHSERTPPEIRTTGGTMHGLQFWVALTTEAEEGPPSFVHVARASLPRLTRRGLSATVALGGAYGLASPIAHDSHPVLVDVSLEPGSRIETPSEAVECGIYVISGSVRVGARTFGEHSLIVTSRSGVAIHAAAASRLVLLGGPPFGPRFIDWNFVSSSKERIERAKEDWKTRRFPSIPGDDVEFVPLPEPRRAP